MPIGGRRLLRFNKHDNPMKCKIEICADSLKGCIVAQKCGADRVELCANMSEGGTTPSYGQVMMARQALHDTRLHVLIRPRGGDFVYSPWEVMAMIEDIKMYRSLHVDGLVFGALTKEGNIDIDACMKLKQAAADIPLTFHRAFDRVSDPKRALEEIVWMGFTRILTSGQMPTAEGGIELLKALNEQADGRIILMAGGGVNESNIRRIHDETGISEFHFSASLPFGQRDPDFGQRREVNDIKITRTIEALK